MNPSPQRYVTGELTIQLPYRTLEILQFSPDIESDLERYRERKPVFTLYPNPSESPFAQHDTYEEMLRKRNGSELRPEFLPIPVLTLIFHGRRVDDIWRELIKLHKKSPINIPGQFIVGDVDGVVSVYFEEGLYSNEDFGRLKEFLGSLEGAEVKD